MNFREYLNEQINQHGAMIIKHTKINPVWKDAKSHESSSVQAANDWLQHNKYNGPKLSITKKSLENHGLMLKSSHPDNLKNLHNDLLNIKH
jgi:hypothetical protein